MTADEIMKILEKAKDCGVHMIRMDGLEVTLYRPGGPIPKASTPFTYPVVPPDRMWTAGAAAINPPIPNSLSDADMKKMEHILNNISSLDEMSEEENLFAATPYFHELQAKKAEHLKKIKEDPNHEQDSSAQ